ncbi:CWC22 Pre-mRNA-splicing factor CWC22 [Candida maltosa Xu316]
MTDEPSQRAQWKSTKETIHSKITHVTESNIQQTTIDLFNLNLIRYKGLLIRQIMNQQLSNPDTFSPILSSLLAIINSKIPEIGQLLISRLILQFKKAYISNNRTITRSAMIFLCHLINQYVVSEVLILQIIQILLEPTPPNNDTLEIAIEIMKINGGFLFKYSKNAVVMILNRLRDLYQDGKGINAKNMKGIGYILKLGRSDFKNVGIVKKELDLVEDDDRETHVVTLDEKVYADDHLNVYRFDEKYNDNENAYNELKQEILGDADNNEEKLIVDEVKKDTKVTDMGQTELLQYQKTVYLTIMSSMSSDEAVHKLLKLSFDKSRKNDTETLADMVIKCCSQEKTYSKYFGVIGEKLISKNHYWHDVFVTLFKHYYSIIENLETNALRNLGKFFGHLFASDRMALDKTWNEIKLTEDDTNPAKRILLKFIFQEMIEELGIQEVKDRLINDNFLKPHINGIFPVVEPNADDLRFSINFFTAIGLGVLTEEMRDVLDNLSEEDDRGRSRSRSYSRSRSGSSSYSRSRSFSRSSSPRGRQEFRSRNTNESRTPSREALKRKRSSSPIDNTKNDLQSVLQGLK